MRRLGVVLVALTVPWACQKPGGVELVVSAPAGMHLDRVRLFVATDTATAASTMTVPLLDGTETAIESPTMFARDPLELAHPDQPLDAVPWAGNGVSITLEAGDGVTALPAVIVVGYQGTDDATAKPVGAAWIANAAVHPHEVDQYAVTLEPINSGNNPTLTVWSPDPSTPAWQAECAAFVGPAANGSAADNGVTTAFVVDPDDLDCDGFANDDTVHECNPDYWRQMNGPGRLSNGACLTADTTGGTCMLGTAECTDGPGVSGGTCAGEICVAPEACALCGGNMTTASPLDCIAQNFPTTGYSCAVQLGTGTSSACTFLLSPPPPTGGLRCDPANSGLLGSDGNVGSAEMIGSVSYALTIGSNCQTQLAVTGATPTSTPPAVLVKIALVNGKSILFPIFSTYAGVDQCGAQCTVGTAGGIYDPEAVSCAASWQSTAHVFPVDLPFMGATSPTLDQEQKVLAMLDVGGDIIEFDGSGGGSDFGSGIATIAALGTDWVSIHLSLDGLRLYAASADSTIQEYTRTSGSAGTWTFAGSASTAGTIDSLQWYQPDDAADVAVIATKDGESDVMSNVVFGQGQMTTIGAGATPFLSADALAVFYASGGTNGMPYGLSVIQRSRSVDQFAKNPSQLLPIPGLSPAPQGTLQPWVSPDGRTMYFMYYDGGGAGSGSGTLMRATR